MNIHTFLKGTLIRHLGLGVLCTIGAFSMGIQTARDVDPFEHSQAALTSEQVVYCDVDGNGIITESDVAVPMSVLPNK